jgi:L-ascorbate metabolism protein UlaG (beta-lactamase superfamily)
MKITFLGHSSLSIETKDKTLLIDPFISGNELAKNVDINKLQADYILITHAHQDHILDVEAIAKRTGAIVISNFEIVTYFENLGIKGHPMNHGGKWTFDFAMGVDEAIKASKFLNCSKILGVHYDTFGYIKVNHKEAFEKFAKAKKELFLLPIGDSLKL